PHTLDELRSRAAGGRTVDWRALRVHATADLQFGRGAADALLGGTVSYAVSKNTGKVRNVRVDGEHVLSLRAEDGWFTLKAAGALPCRPLRHADTGEVVIESMEQAHRVLGGRLRGDRAPAPRGPNVPVVVERDGGGDGRCGGGVFEGECEARAGLHVDSPGQIRTAVAGSKDPNA